MSHAPIISTPAERLATVFAWILTAARRGLASNLAKLGGPIQVMLYRLVGDKITQARDRLVRLAERLHAGWVYTPKPYAPRKLSPQPPRQCDKLTTGSHWLFRAAPGTDTGAAAADLRSLLAEPEVAALLAAAPVPAWRILRSVCWMLGVEKPPVLAKLDRRPPKPPKPAKPPPVLPPWATYQPPPPPPEWDYHHPAPSFFWPWIGPKPKTA
jgi:hypothetical protein